MQAAKEPGVCGSAHNPFLPSSDVLVDTEQPLIIDLFTSDSTQSSAPENQDSLNLLNPEPIPDVKDNDFQLGDDSKKLQIPDVPEITEITPSPISSESLSTPLHSNAFEINYLKDQLDIASNETTRASNSPLPSTDLFDLTDDLPIEPVKPKAVPPPRPPPPVIAKRDSVDTPKEINESLPSKSLPECDKSVSDLEFPILDPDIDPLVTQNIPQDIPFVPTQIPQGPALDFSSMGAQMATQFSGDLRQKRILHVNIFFGLWCIMLFYNYFY